MPAKLIIESEQERMRQEINFEKPQITLGRRSNNDLHFNRPEISGNHAVFLEENGEYWIMDVGSTNGTLLNGAQLIAREKYPLHDQDVITIKPYRITFQLVKDIGVTMMEEAPLVLPGAKSSRKISTGTAEHEKKEIDQVIQSPAVVAEQPAPSAAPAASKKAPPPPVTEARPAAFEAPPPAPAPSPKQTTSRTATAASVAAEVPVEEEEAAGGFRDYIWLAIGGIFVLIALGLTLFILFAL